MREPNSRKILNRMLTIFPSQRSKFERRLLPSVIGLALTIAVPVVAQQPAVVTSRKVPRIGAAIQDSIITLARRQIGKPYVFGGTSPDSGFDCSGLIRYLLKSFNVEMPRNSASQATAGHAVPRDLAKLRVGDLLTFGYHSKVSHIGIYAGNGKFIHASTSTSGVVESLLERPTSRRIKPWIGARRIDVALAAK